MHRGEHRQLHGPLHRRLLLAGLLAWAAAVPGACAQPAPGAPSHVANIVYGASGQKLDLWVPGVARRRAVLLFIHGGGFRSGDKEQMAGYARLYAQGGFVSATIDYRLAPQHPFPAALHDVRDAVAWLQGHAATYGYDGAKIVAIGYSAGGNLALMAAFDPALRLAAVASAAGPTDLRALAAATTLPQLRTDIAAYLGPAAPEAASPLFLARAGVPPTLLLHGDRDTFVPIAQSLVLAQKLQELKVPVLMKVAPGIGHEVLLPNAELKNVLDVLTAFVVAVDQGR
jgi:acetyl esterase/lipase